MFRNGGGGALALLSPRSAIWIQPRKIFLHCLAVFISVHWLKHEPESHKEGDSQSQGSQDEGSGESDGSSEKTSL